MGFKEKTSLCISEPFMKLMIDERPHITYILDKIHKIPKIVT